MPVIPKSNSHQWVNTEKNTMPRKTTFWFVFRFLFLATLMVSCIALSWFWHRIHSFPNVTVMSGVHIWGKFPHHPTSTGSRSILRDIHREWYSLLGNSVKYMKRINEIKSEIQKGNFVQRMKAKSGRACRIPELKPFDESILHVIQKPNATRCEGSRLTYVSDSKLYLNLSRVAGVDYKWCSLNVPVRESDTYNSEKEPVFHNFHGNISKLHHDEELSMRVSDDFFTVTCSDSVYNNYSNTDYDAFEYSHTAANESEASVEMVERQVYDAFAQIFENRDTSELAAKRQGGNTKGLQMNVMMLGVDSTSHMSFLRTLPKSYKYMTETLGAVVLNGYNIVGDATTAALIPMLTGKTEEELPDVRTTQRSRTVDCYPMIWKEFGKAGYVTMFAEDRPDIAVFNLRLNGFRKRPTNHYMRTFWIEMEASRKGLCLGPDLVHNVMLDYCKDFMTSYPRNLKFGFTFLTDIAHANMNRLGLMDDDLHSFFMSVHESGALNNTMLIVFSDHGARYTALRKTMQGKLEERLPFMSFILPPWFKRTQSKAFKNLRTNANRLTTPFDIHATLQSMVNFTMARGTLRKRGMSLLASEVPKERECGHAGIADHWCTCLAWEETSSKEDKLAEGVFFFVLQTINNLTSDLRNHCARLRLSKVLQPSYRMVPNNKVVRFLKTYDRDQRYPEFSNDTEPSSIHNLTLTYQVAMETKPGRGQYEATVKVFPTASVRDVTFELSGEISRINLYGHDADCMFNVNPSIAKFCYCKDNLN